VNGGLDRKVVLVTRTTRLETLIARFHTHDQARFYVEHLGADFAEYETEHAAYHAARRAVEAALQAHGRWQALDRRYLPSFLFGPDDVVVALGQDGVVANTMKYLDDHPLAGLNPDPRQYDGILLPFAAQDFAPLLADVLGDRRPDKRVTMAEARLPDGQRLLAVNDLFFGPPSHTSARYAIDFAGQRETQSSSGVIVSTGSARPAGWQAWSPGRCTSARHGATRRHRPTVGRCPGTQTGSSSQCGNRSPARRPQPTSSSVPATHARRCA
jgi:NAD kinase